MNEELLRAWDVLNREIGAILVSQPGQMTAVAARLAEARESYEALLMKASVLAVRGAA